VSDETRSATGKLAGRSALITGGSKGIGAAIARAYVAEGATVAIVHWRDSDNAAQTLRVLRETNERCLAMECDVADPKQVPVCVEAIQRRLGGIDVLVNSAGIGGGGPFEEVTFELWERCLAVNLTGTFLMSRYCYPLMKHNGWGRIINVASQMAFSGGAEAAPYCASKAGVVGLTRALATEAAQFGVLVNGIAPGATMTDMLLACGEARMAEILRRIPLGRFGTPEEIAPTAVMLASADASFYVGQVLSPNGGDVLR
jgi:3-oxoacyl-[acyl-carrier protein] reductase